MAQHSTACALAVVLLGLAGGADARGVQRPALAAEASGAGIELASVDQQSNARSHTPLKTADRNFLTQALHDSRVEVEIARLAVQRAESPRVRELAQRLIAEHERTYEYILQLARSYGISPSAQSDAARSRPVQSLKRLPAGQFDAKWLAVGIDVQQRTAELFERTAERSDDARIKVFAAERAPAVNQNLERLQAMSVKMAVVLPDARQPN